MINNQLRYHKTTFQQTIQELRKVKNLTYCELSKLTGIPAEKLLDLEEGHHDDILSLSEYEAVCQALQVHSFELVQRLNEQPASKLCLELPQRIFSEVFVDE